MSDTYHKVYAKCWGGKDIYLQTVFGGTRSQCETHIKDRVRAGRATHFLFISKLPIDKAEKRYL